MHFQRDEGRSRGSGCQGQKAEETLVAQKEVEIPKNNNFNRVCSQFYFCLA